MISALISGRGIVLLVARSGPQMYVAKASSTLVHRHGRSATISTSAKQYCIFFPGSGATNMVMFYFHVAGFEPVLEFCADREDAIRKAHEVSFELSAAWNHLVSVQVLDGDGRKIGSIPVRGDDYVSSPKLQGRQITDFEMKLSGCRDLKSLARLTLEHAKQITNSPLGNVQLLDQSGSLEIVAQDGFSEDFLQTFARVTSSHGSACGRALCLRRTVVIHDVQDDPEFHPYLGVADREGFRSVESTPILSSSGSIYGVISAHRAGVGSLMNSQIERLQTLVAVAADKLAALRTAGCA